MRSFCFHSFLLCRGGWVATNLLASDISEEFTCAALPHPSLNLEEKVYGGSVPDLMSRVNRPILLMPTSVRFFKVVSFFFLSSLFSCFSLPSFQHSLYLAVSLLLLL
jgi:hypothetical protein